jgi:hypothetical protein
MTFNRVIFLIIFCLFFRETVAIYDTLRLGKDPKTQYKGFYVGGGGLLSSVDFYRNYRQNPHHLGANIRAYWEFSDNMRIMCEYSHTPKFNLEPTWYDVTSNVFDANLNFLFRIQDQETSFYTITGLSMMRWKGFYTGQGDFNPGSRNIYTPNKEYINHYVGFNAGVGFEHDFNPAQFFGEFRYRLTETEAGFGISDVIVNLGFKMHVYPLLHKKFRDPGKKYNWF